MRTSWLTLNSAAWADWVAEGHRTSGGLKYSLVIAQGVALAAMAFCYFLAPHLAWAYPAVTVVAFVGLVLPAVTTGPLGVAGERLIAASPGRDQLPGATGHTLRATVSLLCSFAAPALVAGVLPSPIGPRSTEPWVAIGCLVAMSAAMVAIVSLAGPSRRGLARFGVLATAAIILGLALGLPGLPPLP